MTNSIAPFPIDADLTAISIAFRNDAQTLIADQVLPKTPVGTKNFKYLSFDEAQAYTIPDTKIGRKSQPNTTEYVGEEKSGTAFDYGLDDIVPIDDIEQARNGRWNYNPLGKAVEFSTDLIMLDREKRVAKIVQATSNYATAQTTALTGTAKWDDTTSNPRDAILKALDVPIMRPNIMVMGREAWTKFRQHPKLVASVQRNDGEQGIVTREQVADLLEINQVLIGDSFINSAKRGQTASFDRTWGKHCAFLYINPQAGTSGGTTWGFTAIYQNRSAGQIQDMKIGARGSIIVRVVESCAEIVVAKRLGYLFQNVVS